MKIVKNVVQILKIKKDSKLIIYGCGAYGTELRCELNLQGFCDYYVCDSNEKVGKGIDNFISLDKLSALSGKLPVCIVIAVKNDEAVNEIVDKLSTLCHEQCNIDGMVSRYVPESIEELIVRRKRDGFYDGIAYKKALDDDEAVQVLRDMITGPKAFLFARWGTTEGNVVYKVKAGIELASIEYIRLQQNAGVFPITEKVIKSYCGIMENAAHEIDMLCAFYWQRNIEKWIEWYSPNAIIVTSAMEYPFFSNTWTKALKGLKVLVIHPFSGLIAKQYQKRDRLFTNPDVLPEFELVTYQAVQSMGGNDVYADWIEALQAMQNDISQINFDIALIGCGAYGMPLGAYIKSKLQKKAIHMGGSLQILFGIKGKRWEGASYDYQHRLYNEHWVRPADDLKPRNYLNVENGCYW